MNDQNQKCEKCGKPLEESQYASTKPEGEPAENSKNKLVCRNYPDCPKAEKENNE